MTYTVLTHYHGQQSIADDYPTIDEATEAYIDMDWMACNAPADISDAIRQITIIHGDKVLRSRSYP
jgi:hypothetical protein